MTLDQPQKSRQESTRESTQTSAQQAPLVGLLVVDKPLGWSSMAVVRRVRRAAGGAKTGHAGTLDPLATGVVICCLGKATRCVPALMGMTKVYDAKVDLSAFTTTDDREGPREEMAVERPPTEAELRAAIPRFLGEVTQTPPAFSAVHVDGKRAYKLARQGKPVTIQPRIVRIDAIELLSYAWPLVDLRITCGKGTYIRSLARDLGKALGVGGHLAALRRTAVGRYDLAIAVTSERLERPITQADLLPAPTVAG
ncbi:MAG: tRNA pseudouridine(55) synthase TruB [Planctomycetota bacterium]|nr:tRNA pseudouridine(55) synthase TruB [Planctomycetota bacterium]